MTTTALNWPTNTVYVDTMRDMPEAGEGIRLAHTKAWRPHRGLMRALESHWPREWSHVRTCRSRWTWKPCEGRREPQYQVDGWECEAAPYCPGCNNRGQRKRTAAAMERIRMATPRDADSRIVGVTIAPRQDPEWRDMIGHDHRRYMRAAHRVLEMMYGENVGALITYQDHGETPFLHHHPHVHATVNGWQISPQDEVRERWYFDLTGGRKAAVLQALCDQFEKEYGAHPHFKPEYFSLDIEFSAKGEPAFAKWVKYQLRELVDPTKWEYERGAEYVTIRNYHDPLKAAQLRPSTIVEGIDNYARRLGRWGSGRPGHRNIDGYYGILSDKRIKTTAQRMGYQKKHGTPCFCTQCLTRGPRVSAPDKYDGAPLQSTAFDW